MGIRAAWLRQLEDMGDKITVLGYLMMVGAGAAIQC